MSTSGPRKFSNIVEAAIEAKGDIKEATATTFRSDASAILEALAAELDPETVEAAVRNQGLKPSPSYLSTFRSLAEVARHRRSQRLAGADLVELTAESD